MLQTNYLCRVMLKILFWLFLIGLIYRVVFSYLLPILRMTSAATGQVRHMQEQMKEMERRMREQPQPKTTRRVNKDGDYIDYEEVA
jgi:hypothetical protein